MSTSASKAAAQAADRLLGDLGRPGPHRVLRGDLTLAGLPGLVFTPASGLGLAAVAFGHGWLQPPTRYQGLLRHLASWGFVVAAPSQHVGPFPLHGLYASDLTAALDICVRVRLGDGEISVDPDRLGVAGHSVGGGAAVLAAADDLRIRAVATLAASEVQPSAVQAATRCRVPGLHLAAGRDLTAPPVGNAEAIAGCWRGPVTLRTVPKASHLGFTEGRHYSDLLLDGRPQAATQQVARALLAAFFLVELAGEQRYRPVLDEDNRRCPIQLRRPGRPVAA